MAEAGSCTAVVLAFRCQAARANRGGKLTLFCSSTTGPGSSTYCLSPNDHSAMAKLLARRIVPDEQAQKDACMHVGDEVNIAYDIRLTARQQTRIAYQLRSDIILQNTQNAICHANHLNKLRLNRHCPISFPHACHAA
ncbi:hypothetical protein KC359_g197 [Hortaea werneckii]|nr:hypothetical protein KC359_g197 [Hortaea werneckii]